MNGILGVVIFVLDIIAILDIFKSQKTSGKKILWTLVVLIVPLIGMIAYFVVGKKKAT